MVVIKTNFGEITIKLHEDKTPKTVENFLQYVNKGFYDGTIFHRVIDGFMIQGGGFTTDMEQKTVAEPIENEAELGAKNARGTVAMARTMEPHSATAQFFINVKDNHFLNYSAKTPQGYGYCVFGEVVNGMDVVDEIRKVATGSRSGHGDVPVDNVVIESVSLANGQ